MRNCSGVCAFCSNPCYRGEIKGKEEKISPFSPEELEGINNAFDTAEVKSSVVLLQDSEVQPEETGLSVVENIGTYEIKRTIFGREKLRKSK